MPRHAKGPYLYLRERSGRAQIWVIRDGSREVSTGCLTHDHDGAQRKLEKYLAEKFRPSGASDPSRVFIAEVLKVYRDNKIGSVHRPDVLEFTINSLNEWWGARLLSEVKGATCREYVAWRAGRKWAKANHSPRKTARTVSVSTARRDLETLRAAIRHYHAEYTLDSVPVVTMPEKAPPRERWLTRSEVARMLWAARRDPKSRHLARFILVGIYTGTRHDAILRLGWMPNTIGGWLDTEAGLIYRRAAGARETRKRQPPARLPNRLLAHLRRWRELDARQGIKTVVHYKGDPIGKMRRAWNSARDVAGLGEDVVPHCLRHTAATWMMQSGMDRWIAAGVLGMTVETLEAVYGHHSPDFQEGVRNAF